MRDPEPWLCFGLQLRLASGDQGRRRPILVDPERPYSYRADWQWDTMAGLGLVGAPIYCASNISIAPGEAARVVIIPAAPQSLLIWALLSVGEQLRMHEGSRVVGHASVVWAGHTLLPVPAADGRRFQAWADGAQADP